MAAAEVLVQGKRIMAREGISSPYLYFAKSLSTVKPPAGDLRVSLAFFKVSWAMVERGRRVLLLASAG